MNCSYRTISIPQCNELQLLDSISRNELQLLDSISRNELQLLDKYYSHNQ